jgi:hypothetical protein
MVVPGPPNLRNLFLPVQGLQPVFLGLLDPDPLVRGMDPYPSFYHQAKIVRSKTLIPTVL